MKGFSFFGVIILAIIAFLVAEFFYLQLGLRDSAIVRRTLRDIKISEDINIMEFLKRAQKPSIEYSFYETYEFLGKRGGFLDLTQISSYDCIPYWQNYNTKNLPDIKQNIEKTSTLIFDMYMNVFKNYGIYTPNYMVLIEDVQPPYPQTINIQANSQEDIELTFEKIKVIEKSSFTHQVPIDLFQEYKVAKENLIDTDNIKKTVDEGITSAGLISAGSKTECGVCPSDEDVFIEINGKGFSVAKNDIKNSIIEKTSNLKNNLVSTGLEIDIQPDVASEITSSCVDTIGDSCDSEKNWCTKTCNFVFTGVSDVAITVENKTMKYLIGNEFKSIPLKFKIIDGSLTVTPNTNDCGETI